MNGEPPGKVRGVPHGAEMAKPSVPTAPSHGLGRVQEKGDLDISIMGNSKVGS